jgi:hypothetical protein
VETPLLSIPGRKEGTRKRSKEKRVFYLRGREYCEQK